MATSRSTSERGVQHLAWLLQQRSSTGLSRDVHGEDESGRSGRLTEDRGACHAFDYHLGRYIVQGDALDSLPDQGHPYQRGDRNLGIQWKQIWTRRHNLGRLPNLPTMGHRCGPTKSRVRVWLLRGVAAKPNNSTLPHNNPAIHLPMTFLFHIICGIASPR